MHKTLIIILIAISLSVTGCYDTNDMVPWSAYPKHENLIIQTKNGQWIVMSPSCPVVYDQNGEFDPSQNWGCANTRNLGLMLANPKDLLPYKRPPIKYDTKPLAIDVDKYRNNKLPRLRRFNRSNFFFTPGGSFGEGATSSSGVGVR